MSVRTFRLLCLAEAVTWVTLICASIAKRALELDIATKIVGPIHGTAFLAYFCGLLLIRDDLGWDLKRTAGAAIASLVPLGTWLIVERRWLAGVEDPVGPSAA
jgi:integral membrane protein